MPFSGALITLTGARQIFSTWDIAHNDNLQIYEAFRDGKVIQARTLIGLCKTLVDEMEE